MKAPIWMIFGLLLAILIMDVTKVMMVRGKIINTVEHSLDAAMIAGINKDDAVGGKLIIDEYAGSSYALIFFKEGLQLDSRLENANLKDTYFRITFTQDAERPKATAEVSTIITAISPRALGMEGVPVKIRKIQYHLVKFKGNNR